MIDIDDDDIDITGPHHIHLSVCLFTGNGHDWHRWWWCWHHRATSRSSPSNCISVQSRKGGPGLQHPRTPAWAASATHQPQQEAHGTGRLGVWGLWENSGRLPSGWDWNRFGFDFIHSFQYLFRNIFFNNIWEVFVEFYWFHTSKHAQTSLVWAQYGLCQCCPHCSVPDWIQILAFSVPFAHRHL